MNIWGLIKNNCVVGHIPSTPGTGHCITLGASLALVVVSRVLYLCDLAF